MPDYLNVPSDLQYLIEKRERDNRRAGERREDEVLETSDILELERRGHERRADEARRKGDG
ncbi:MAG: hypothetical protein H8E66_31115 [Planctomycetes bacterium]|nr:hypothetical protein [Planctomycetota bacterium]